MRDSETRPEAKLSDNFNHASYKAWQEAVDRGEIEPNDDEGADRVEARRVAQLAAGEASSDWSKADASRAEYKEWSDKRIAELKAGATQ